MLHMNWETKFKAIDKWKDKSDDNTLISQEKVNFECEYCRYVATTKKVYVNHIKKHLPEKRTHSCSTCQKKLLSESNLSNHVIKCHSVPQRNFHCELCDTYYSRHTQLKVHTRENHTMERPFKCSLCDKAFKRKNHLKGHVLFHTGEKPYKCDFCHNSFASDTSLRLHRYIHTQEKPYKCDKCDDTFRQPHHVKDHALQKHTIKFKEKCEHCKKSFTNVRNHLKTHSNVMYYICDICNRGFRFVTSHTEHRKTHFLKNGNENSNECKQCKKSFSSINTMRRHLLTHTEEKVKQ